MWRRATHPPSAGLLCRRTSQVGAAAACHGAPRPLLPRAPARGAKDWLGELAERGRYCTSVRPEDYTMIVSPGPPRLRTPPPPGPVILEYTPRGPPPPCPARVRPAAARRHAMPKRPRYIDSLPFHRAGARPRRAARRVAPRVRRRLAHEPRPPRAGLRAPLRRPRRPAPPHPPRPAGPAAWLETSCFYAPLLIFCR
jgi:hypothetical protein